MGERTARDVIDQACGHYFDARDGEHSVLAQDILTAFREQGWSVVKLERIGTYQHSNGPEFDAYYVSQGDVA
jgi:hypothetical protein